MQNKLLTIGKAAEMLGISVDTLRRWDATGRLKSIRSGALGHRFYSESDIKHFLQDIESIGRNWVFSQQGTIPQQQMYCATRDIFQARLEKFQTALTPLAPLETVSLVTAVAGEIGNNSYDHNIGNWPDIPGIYFAYSMRNRTVVLADRGLGVLATLKRARPKLSTSTEALKVAFTERVSGRYHESRGNGLKFVRQIIIDNPFTLYFQTDDAQLYLKRKDSDITVQNSKTKLSGCFVIIGFESLI